MCSGIGQKHNKIHEWSIDDDKSRKITQEIGIYIFWYLFTFFWQGLTYAFFRHGLTYSFFRQGLTFAFFWQGLTYAFFRQGLTYDSDWWIKLSLWTESVLDIHLGEWFVGVRVIGRALYTSPLPNGDIPANHTVQHTAMVLSKYHSINTCTCVSIILKGCTYTYHLKKSFDNWNTIHPA